MSNKRIANLLAEEVNTQTSPEEDVPNSTAITPAHQDDQTSAIVEVSPRNEGLFAESRQLFEEVLAFDREHELTAKVTAQLWRLTKMIVKPAFIVTWKGIETAAITVVDPDKRDDFAERFRRAKDKSSVDVSLKAVDEEDD